MWGGIEAKKRSGKKISAGYVLRFEKQRVVIIGHKTWDICACDEAPRAVVDLSPCGAYGAFSRVAVQLYHRYYRGG